MMKANAKMLGFTKLQCPCRVNIKNVKNWARHVLVHQKDAR